MKNAGTVTLEENSSEEKYISDEKIQALLRSDCMEDRLLGRFFLIKKYPTLRRREFNEWEEDSFVVKWDEIEHMSSIKRMSPGHVGLVIENSLVSFQVE